MKKNIEKLEKRLFEKAIGDIKEMFNSIQGVGFSIPDWNYEYSGLGSYEFVSRREKVEFISLEKGIKLIFPNIKFQINDRINKKNLFEWEYLFLYQDIDKDFYKKLKEEKLFNKDFLKKVFGDKENEFEDTIKLIIEKEYEKKYEVENINTKVFYYGEKKLKEGEVKVDFVANDNFYLYYSLNEYLDTKKEKLENLKIMGIYSLEVDELENKKDLKKYTLSFCDIVNMKKYLKSGKSLKEWLLKELKKY